MWSKLQSAVWSSQIVTLPSRIKYPTGLHSWRVSKMSHKCCFVQTGLACMCLLACVCLKCSISSGGKMDDWKVLSSFHHHRCSRFGALNLNSKSANMAAVLIPEFTWKKSVTVNLKREIQCSTVIIIIIIVVLDEFERWKITSFCNSQPGLLAPQGAPLLLPRG